MTKLTPTLTQSGLLAPAPHVNLSPKPIAMSAQIHTYPELPQQTHRHPPLWRRDVISKRPPFFFTHVKQLAAIVIALGFGFGLWFGVLNYTAPRPSDQHPAGMTYIGNGIYQLPDGTYTGDIPQGTDTSYWNNIVYPSGYPYGFSGGTMNNPMYYYNLITGAYGSLGEGEGLKEHRTVQELKSTAAKQEAMIARQQKQIEALSAGLQKVSAQLEVSRPAPQTTLNNQ